MSEENILYYDTLITTYNELIKIGHIEIAERIKSILQTNKFPKPSQHNRKDDLETSKYLIELLEEEIEIIRDLFLSLEVANISEEGNTTPLASLYGAYFDIWAKINPLQK